MSQNTSSNLDDWDPRAAKIDLAISAAFPVALFDRDSLRKLTRDATGSTGGIFARLFGSAWVDDELPKFLRLLQDHDWRDIDWNSHWIVIPLLPRAIFDYCLPGIMHWILIDPDFVFEAAWGLVKFHLAPPLVEGGESGFDFSFLDSDQKRAIAEFLSLLHDFTLADEPELRESTQTVVRYLSGMNGGYP